MPANPCIKSVNHSRVKVEENGRKVVFINIDRELYDIHRVDGCLVKNETISDYLVSRRGDVSVVVELKGADVQHACTQALATAEHPTVAPLMEAKIGFLIVCRRYPRFDTYVAKAKIKCMKNYRAGLHIVCDQRELDIDRVASIDGPY